MSLLRAGAGTLDAVDRPIPSPGPGQILVKVAACGVCRTDLHVVDGELPNPKIPVIPGHEIVGRVERIGAGVSDIAEGDRVGIPWLAYSDGVCEYCRSGRENLCPRAQFTGYQRDGGYAEYTVADARYAFPLPPSYADAAAAPLLCAGLIGYRAYRMAGEGKRIGLYGFGAAAHIIVQVARHQGREVYAFTRSGNDPAGRFALELGAAWVGASSAAPPEPLDAAIIFAPVGGLVVEALTRVRPGGIVVCAGIHMSDIPSFPYRILWEERVVRSVANLTRADAREFLSLAPKVPVRTETTTYPLEDANRALSDVRAGRLVGAAVIVPTAAG